MVQVYYTHLFARRLHPYIVEYVGSADGRGASEATSVRCIMTTSNMSAGRARDGLCGLLPPVLRSRDLWVRLFIPASVTPNLDDCSNVFGGNFSLVGVPSVGASGAIFGTIGVRRTR